MAQPHLPPPTSHLRTLPRRVYAWLDDRVGISETFLPMLRHPVPRNVNWWYVFGSATLTAFIFQVITGVALAFTYVPAPNSAHESLEFITNNAILGSVVRGIHFWGASAMVILIAAHALRVFLMGSYKFPREVNWLSGVLLLFLTLAMAITGQLLRWDQDAYWGILVATESAGRAPLIGPLLAQIVLAGQTVGGGTLTRFYATHVFLIPALMFGLIGLHLWLVLRAGISEPPKAGVPVDRKTYRERYDELLKKGIPFFPDAAWKDAVFAIAVGAVVLALAIVIGPPQLGKPADPTNIQANPRPDWYFIWLFALLAIIPPEIENWAIIGTPLVAAVVLIALPFVANQGERSPTRRPWAVAIAGLTVLGIAVLVAAGYQAPWSPDTAVGPLPASVTQGLTPSQARGAQIFQSFSCHQCHAIAGTGGEKGPNLTAVGSRLTRDELIIRISNGGGGMPAYAGNLTPDELDALADFLQTRKE